MSGYGIRPNLQRLLQSFGDEQEVVLKAWRFYGWTFRTDIGVNQGGLLSPTVFIIVVDSLSMAVLLEVYGMQ